MPAEDSKLPNTFLFSFFFRRSAKVVPQVSPSNMLCLWSSRRPDNCLREEGISVSSSKDVPTSATFTRRSEFFYFIYYYYYYFFSSSKKKKKNITDFAPFSWDVNKRRRRRRRLCSRGRLAPPVHSLHRKHILFVGTPQQEHVARVRSGKEFR